MSGLIGWMRMGMLMRLLDKILFGGGGGGRWIFMFEHLERSSNHDANQYSFSSDTA